MIDLSIGFIGGGRVARILLGGWLSAAAMPPRVVVSDPSEVTLDILHARFPGTEVRVGANPRAALQDVVFLCVHPPIIGEVAAEIREHLRPDAVLVSLAPRVTIGHLATALGGFDRIARVIPNAPSIVGAGFNPVSFGAGLPGPDRETVLSLLAPLGHSPVVDEAKLNAYAVLTAMGPTYLWFQLYELRDLARSFGLEPEEAATGIDRMTSGALATMTRSGLSPTEVMDLIPVRPLGDFEAELKAVYRARLGGVIERLRPT